MPIIHTLKFGTFSWIWLSGTSILGGLIVIDGAGAKTGAFFVGKIFP